MDELVLVMRELLSEMKRVNDNLEEIKGYGLYNSISDLNDCL